MKSSVSYRKPKLAFHFQSMGSIYDDAKGLPDESHRHDYFTVMIIDKAKGTHVIDYETYSFGKREMHFVSPGQIHQVQLSERPVGYVITFSKAFLVENNISLDFIYNINLFKRFGQTPPVSLDFKTYRKIEGLLVAMEGCMQLDTKYKFRALGSLLQLCLIYTEAQYVNDEEDKDFDSKRVCLLRDFKNQVESDFTQSHKVVEYADKLNISAKHLSHTIKNMTGKTAKTYIQDRLLLEAKRLLLHSELSIKEVAFKLGFQEPLHFSGFFKKQMNMSPTDYKNQWVTS